MTIEDIRKAMDELGPPPKRKRGLYGFDWFGRDMKRIAEEMDKELERELLRPQISLWGFGMDMYSNRAMLLNPEPAPAYTPHHLWGLRVVEMPDYLVPRISVQNRTHRRRRINKKWAKRYGFHSEMDPKALDTWFLVGEEGGQALHIYACRRPKLDKILADMGIPTLPPALPKEAKDEP